MGELVGNLGGQLGGQLGELVGNWAAPLGGQLGELMGNFAGQLDGQLCGLVGQFRRTVWATIWPHSSRNRYWFLVPSTKFKKDIKKHVDISGLTSPPGSVRM